MYARYTTAHCKFMLYIKGQAECVVNCASFHADGHCDLLVAVHLFGAGQLWRAHHGGRKEPFEVYVWSPRTSRCLDVLYCHEGSVS